MDDDTTIPSRLGPINTMPAPLGPMASSSLRESASGSGAWLKLVLAAVVVALVVWLAR